MGDTQPEVASTTLPDEPPHGLRGERTTEPDYLVWSIVLVLTLLAGAMLTAILLWLRRRAARQAPVNAVHAAVDRAQELRLAVERLEWPSLESAGNVDALIAAEQRYFEVLSLHLRSLMELRTGVPVAEATLQELASLLQQAGAKDQEALMRFFARTDLLKFAGVRTDATEAAALKTQVLHWLRDAATASGRGP